MRIDDREIALLPAGEGGAPLIFLLCGEGEEGERVFHAVKGLAEADFSLAAVVCEKWDDVLSPWPAPAVMRKAPPFSGGADGFIRWLSGRAVPGVVAALGQTPAYLGLAGYSLAGLAALYALYRTDIFSRAASVSGSLWYPGFLDFARERAPMKRPDRIYFSLGDREAATKNPVMRTVEENARALCGHYAGQGIETTFELNPGNHFQDSDGRTARGVAWLIR